MSKNKRVFFSIIALIFLAIIVLSYFLSSSEIDKAIFLEKKGFPGDALFIYKNVLLKEPTNEIAFEKVLNNYIKNKNYGEVENVLSIYFEALKKDETKSGESEEIKFKKGLFYKQEGLYHVERILNIKSLITDKRRGHYEMILEKGRAIIALEASLRYHPDDQKVKELLSTIKDYN